MTKLQSYAPTVLRMGISLVIMWFGSQQILHVSAWIGYLPDWTLSLPISQENIVYLNGAFEVIFGLFMFAGFYTRMVAFFIALHMLEIVHVVGYNPTGVRDFAIAVSVISIFLRGSDDFSVDKLWQR